jgi:hypothetical protein
VGLFWWGEAPERLSVTSGGSAASIDATGWVERRAEPLSIAGPRLGAFIGVTHWFNWCPSISLVELAVFREPRPTKFLSYPNSRRHTKTAATAPAKSASRPAKIACRMRVIPTEPK